MKKVLVCMLAVGLAATAANAATLYMTFPGGATEASLMPGQSVNVEVYLTLKATDSRVDGFTCGWWGPNPADSMDRPLEQTASAPALLDWVQSSDQGLVGDAAPGLAFFAPSAGVNAVMPGTSGNLLGTATIILNDAGDMSDLQLSFRHQPDNSNSSVSIFGYPSGATFNFGPGFETILPDYYTYGTGAPAVDAGAFGAVAANPLIIHRIPEPASLALLALGGLAILRRR